MLSLLYDIVPPSQREQAIRNVVDDQSSMTGVGSPFAMFYFLECFEKLNRHEAILSSIREYWSQMLEHGSSTFWEFIDPEWPTGNATWPTRSRCHGWSAAPIDSFTRILLGVRPLRPGFTETLIAPTPCGLSHAEGNVPTPHGPLHVKWTTKEDGTLNINVNAPPEVHCKIEYP